MGSSGPFYGFSKSPIRPPVYAGKDLLMSRQWILMAILMLAGAWLRLANFGNVVTRTPDERVYTWQARTWLESGQAGMRSMVAEYKADAETKFYPPPTRVGMIRLVAAMMQWTGRSDESVGARISCAASIGSLLVLALIGMRFLPPWTGQVSLLFYAVLPAELAVSRRTWTDAMVELAGLLLIWFVCEITRDPARRFWYLLFALVSGVSILVKESMPVPIGLCGLWIVWVLLKRRDWTNMLVFISATAAGMALSLWWLSGQVGSLADYVGIVTGIPKANAGNPYALEYASGPPYLLLRAFWIVTPIASLLSLAGLYSVLRRPSDAEPRMAIALFVVAHIAIAMAMPHWLNLRYVGVTFGPFCVLAGLGGGWLISLCWDWLDAADRRPFAVLALAIIIGGAVADYLRFQRVFVRDETIDLSIRMLMDERNQ